MCSTSLLRALLCVLFVGTFFHNALFAQQPDYPLGGASKPRPQMKPKDQYKRVHQLALRYMLRNRFAEAQTLLEDFLDERPEDAESRFMMGILRAQEERADAAIDQFQRAVELGLPEQRIIAGPRSLLKPIAHEDYVQRLFERHETAPIHGPMVGDVTDQSASVWIRTAQESEITVIVARDAALSEVIAREPGSTAAEDDFTCVVTVDGLRPASKYHYGIQIDDGPVHSSRQQWFRTFQRERMPVRFTLAFGGGAGFVPNNERMWNTIDGVEPDLMLMLGDNVYIDDPESVEMQQYTYYRRQSRPEWRGLVAHTPVFSIWDDHDFSTNDSWGGPDVDVPFWKRDYVWKTFKQNWSNPGYGGGQDQPGCWYTFSVGDVAFIMLDCRYYRTDPRGDNPTMLGPAQLQWLKEQLARSKGTFKVLCSSVPWDFRTKGASLDTWNGYRDEREEIFSFIEDNQIEGIVLMSADRHRSDAWLIERPDGYDFHELNSSRLTNQHRHGEKDQAIFSYNEKQSFGRVTFDTIQDTPQVTYDVITIDGERKHSLTISRGQLEY